MDEQPPQKRVKLRNDQLDAQDSGKSNFLFPQIIEVLVENVMKKEKKNVQNEQVALKIELFRLKIEIV